MNKYEKAFNIILHELLHANVMLPISISNIKELVERATPKKIPYNHWGLCDCGYEPDIIKEIPCITYCPSCGQALNWEQE